MGADTLADTGAIIACLDSNDRWHPICSRGLSHLRLKTGWRFVLSGVVELLPIRHSELPHIHALMSRYSDHPMDFADATLVHIAKRESLTNIFTIDRHFHSYRIEGRRGFRVLPSERP